MQKSYKADYISPNVEKLLGFTVEQIQKDIRILAKLHPWDSEDSKKNYLEGIRTSEQQEWDFEYVHQKQENNDGFTLWLWAVR